MAYVISRLKGGLGNQMFQYAAGLALARRLRVPLLLDRSFLDSRPPGMDWTPRSFELDVFRADHAFATDEQVRLARRPLENAWYGRACRILPHLFPDHTRVERGTGYQPALLPAQAPVYLEGFWQNENYFAALAEELRNNLFVPREPVDGRNAELVDLARSGCSASLHVRRGDYVSNPGARLFHGTCPVAYYENAARWLVEERGVDHFLLFSDEPDWVRSNLVLPYRTTIVSHNTGRDSHWDIHIMRNCSHHVIANSSFSWWGAWLHGGQNGIVIAPARWFQDGTPATHIVPASWLLR